VGAIKRLVSCKPPVEVLCLVEIDMLDIMTNGARFHRSSISFQANQMKKTTTNLKNQKPVKEYPQYSFHFVSSSRTSLIRLFFPTMSTPNLSDAISTACFTDT